VNQLAEWFLISPFINKFVELPVDPLLANINDAVFGFKLQELITFFLDEIEC
jgi:hypothetical protein